MIIKLCYKEYQCKLNLAAMKSFSEKTGKDLNYTLLRYLEVCRNTAGKDSLTRLSELFGVESFNVVAMALHCMIVQEDKSISLAEIEDSMFRVGWLPTDDDDGEMCQAYPLVVAKLATEVSDYYATLDKKKVVI